jgi:hypothetical protein
VGNSVNKTTSQLDARDITQALERRFGSVGKDMEPDLVAAEEACWDEKLKPRRALSIVQSLRRHEETLRAISTHARAASIPDAGLPAGVRTRTVQ